MPNPLAKPWQIGPIRIECPVMLAPMTGISDVPFRNLAQSLGAPLVFSEMVAGKEQLKGTHQSDRMASFAGTKRPHAIQLAGRDPATMADAAKFNADRGVDLIDINFGCPAKKVTGGLGGAAILKDEPLAAQILQAVVDAVDIPVTLKFRLGWDQHSINAINIAKIAEDAGILSLTLHGRTRAQFYDGHADWHAIAQVKAATSLPLIANGDIENLKTARQALEITGADGLMLGRATLGRPWLPGELAAQLQGQPPSKRPDLVTLIENHIAAMIEFYGETQGLRIARKHVAAYLENWPNQDRRREFNALATVDSYRSWLDKLRLNAQAQLAA